MPDQPHAPPPRDDLQYVAAWAATSVPKGLSARGWHVRVVALCLVPLFLVLPFLGSAAAAVGAAVVALAVGLRLVALVDCLRGPRPTAPSGPAALPNITVLLPLKDEAAVTAGLVEAVLRLDYPSSLIQVIALVEEDDPDTRSLLRECAPCGWRIVAIPKGEIQTKPRACNVGLALATGEIVVVFDGEDRPEPDQARKAVSALAQDPGCGVAQARLGCDHGGPGEHLLARYWALEYAVHFGAIQPALARRRLPFLLGGTSNWLRTDALRAVGGWDAYNVTEDADLGVRLARAGWTSTVIDSATWEEAPICPGQWMKQRSRWLMGFAMTTAVHFSRPDRLLVELRPAATLAIIAQLPATLLCALLHPLGLVLALTPPYGPLAALGLAGYAISVALHAVVARRNGFPVWLGLSVPFYWLLQTLALVLAVADLAWDPTRWRKTEHGLVERPASTGLSSRPTPVERLRWIADQQPAAANRMPAAVREIRPRDERDRPIRRHPVRFPPQVSITSTRGE